MEIWNVTSRTLGSAVLEMGWDVVMVVWWNKNFCVGFVVLKIRCRKERTVVMVEAQSKECQGRVEQWKSERFREF